VARASRAFGHLGHGAREAVAAGASLVERTSRVRLTEAGEILLLRSRCCVMPGSYRRCAQAAVRNSWLENRYFGKGSDYGRGTAFDTGYNGTGFWTFAQSHPGTAIGVTTMP
jgi:hypothetical protein